MLNRKAHNKFAFLIAVVLAMLMTAPTFAASKNWIDRVPAVKVDQEITNEMTPKLAIEEYSEGEFTDEPQNIRLVLSGAEWLEEDHEYGPDRIELDSVLSGDASEIQVNRLSSTILDVTLTATGDAVEKGVWRIPLYTRALEVGEINVQIDARGSLVTGSLNAYADGVGDSTEVIDDPEDSTEPETPQEPEELEEPETTTTTEVTFTIGQTGYWVNGQWMASDIAPYIQSINEELGRIMVPVRFVAEATGADEVVWDPIGRNVIVLKGDTQLQMTISSTQLLVNETVMEMDAVAEIQDIGSGLGRTMVPLAHLASALNVDYEWKPETRSVTFSVVE